MQLLSHNININRVIYNIHSELTVKKKVDVIISEIKQEGEVIWSKKRVYNKSDKISKTNALDNSHRNAILYLKKVFDGNVSRECNINILRLNNLIIDFKNDFGKGIFFIELFKEADGTLIAGYNKNKFATDVYFSIYEELMSNLKLIDMKKTNLKYFYLEISKDIALVVGNIKGTDISFSLLLNLSKVGVGMFFNSIYPRFINIIFEEIKV